MPQGGIPGGEEPRSAIDRTALRGALHDTTEFLPLREGPGDPRDGKAGWIRQSQGTDSTADYSPAGPRNGIDRAVVSRTVYRRKLSAERDSFLER